MKKKLCVILAAGLMLSACGSQGGTQPETAAQETIAEAEAPAESTEEVTEGEPAETDASKAKTDTNSLEDASAYTSSVESSTIDASIYLDYSAGIEAGVYKWVKSEDGTYYTLTAVDENGEPIEKEETAINVGANNQESIDNGQGVMPGGGENGQRPEGMGGGESGQRPEGMGGGEKGQRPEGGMPQGGRPEGGKGGHGGMGMGGGGTVYQGVYMNANITNLSNQTMAIYVPAEYFTTDAEGNVTGINHEGAAGGYTADTAPIVYLNECGGWKSSSPRSCDTSYIEQGMIYVTAGARSRDAVSEDGTTRTGKAPTQMADLKSGIIELRANEDVIPGDKDKIVSVGTSGGGQMSSILGASGNMPEYYEYMYEAGTLGVAKNADGTYTSAYPDNIYAAQLYCPIADIENADLAYAWWWVDLADAGGTYGGSMTAFEKRLQELEAEAFIPYLNSLGLTDAEGNALTLDGLRSGSYYDAVLANVSAALNAAVAAGDLDPETAYPDSESWLTKNDDGTWSITDMAGFMVGTGLVNNRNKAIPGFDAMDKSAENNAFGASDTESVHFSASVAQILQENYEELSALEGFDKEQVDSYIEEALTGEQAALAETQTNLLNATEIMLGSDGLTAVDPAEHWRDRSGTADQHTSFSVGYNILLAAQALGKDIDYHLVWDMGHGSNEGTSTGTFIEWINEICAGE